MHHPAWRLLCANHAPLILSFLQRVFVEPNVRAIGAVDLADALEQDLYALREQSGGEDLARPPLEYLEDWASPDKGYLRRFYKQGSDEPQFDLTPASEKVIAWLGTLTERSFIGTESRLLTITNLAKQMVEGSETDPKKRIDELTRRRDALDAEIAQIVAGNTPLLNETQLKDYWQQFTQASRELLTDFRAVEENFRNLDRHTRERIARFTGSKGALIAEILTERDAITGSDQGRSFRAFWDFLMSQHRQDEFARMLEQLLALPVIVAFGVDGRTRSILADCLTAAVHTQRVVAQLSDQLRRLLDEGVWHENRRILDILRNIETHALALRDDSVGALSEENFMQIEHPVADIDLPMERPMYVPAFRVTVVDEEITVEEDTSDISVLFDQVHIDKVELANHVRRILKDKSQVTLAELITARPLTQGLAELIAYLQVGTESFQTVADDTLSDCVTWASPKLRGGESLMASARLERIIFTRSR
jgi:hypothetical protein